MSETHNDLQSLRNELDSLCLWLAVPQTQAVLRDLETKAAACHQTAELPLDVLAKTTGSFESAKELRHELLCEARGLRHLSRYLTARQADLEKQLNPDNDNESVKLDRSDGGALFDSLV